MDKNAEGPNEEVIGQEEDGRRAPERGREMQMEQQKRERERMQRKKSEDSTGN